MTIEKTSLRDRTGQAREVPQAGTERTPETKPLRERSAQTDGLERSRYRKEDLPPLPLAERIVPAAKGLFLDPSALADMLRRSADAPLREFLTEKQMEDIRAECLLTGRSGPPTTYGEAMRWIHESWSSRTAVSGSYTYDDLPDLEYDIFLELWRPYFIEVSRRQKAGSSEDTDRKNYSVLLPVLALPVPQYFQAAAACSTDRSRKTFFLRQYQLRYRGFAADQGSQVSGYAKNLHGVQPHRDVSCLDAATMVCVVFEAQKKKQISQNRCITLTHDLIVAPYL